MAPRYRVTLTSEERQELETVARPGRICRLEMNSGVAENEQWRRFGMNARVVSG